LLTHGGPSGFSPLRETERWLVSFGKLRIAKELDQPCFAFGKRVPAPLRDHEGDARAVKAERGTLDIVFANAGAGSQLALGKITAEHIDETFDTNVKGTIFTVQKALPLMGEGGSIILTGSSAGTTGAPAFSAHLSQG
jgi:NAD(P)-dependent dehydrogenase (short-subunit alcohol dehydrogenase family)